ncbi:serine protease [Sporosarcina gallistercoris]|uniref:S1C family serine protease n=1 Tax=Sporosarcina gallistercoris TaxID=2762245 RepID=UPI003D2D369C
MNYDEKEEINQTDKSPTTEEEASEAENIDSDDVVDKHELTLEEIEQEEFHQLVLEAQREALEKEAFLRNNPHARKRRVPKWIVWLMAAVLLFQPVAFIFDIYSLPAIDFLKTSAKLSKREDITKWKQSVAVVLTEDGKGTGFSVSPDGLVVTNNHVVENTKQITVSFEKHGRFSATLVAQDSVNDLAILQIKNPPDIPSLKLAESPIFTPESKVRFIGNPLNFFGIANEGKLIGESAWAGREAPIILLDAPIYRGNSGSPVFQDEEVIGVVFAITELDTYGKVGMFIRSNEVLELLKEVK